MRELLKRALDLGIAIGVMPAALPVIGLAACCVRLESRGNPIFLQTRLGRHGRPFRVFKLRTMVQGAERLGAGLYAQENDPRFTRLGKLLRKYSVDELPQLFNVVLGDMSIVGPRPMVREVVQSYAEAYQEILKVRPGMTGLAQVSGRNELPRSRRLQLDQEYAKDWTLHGDLCLLIRTFGVVLRAEGQRNDQSRSDVER